MEDMSKTRKTIGGDKYWWQYEVENHIAEYNEWKRKQEEERKLAEQYGMPYGEEVGDAQE